MDKKSKSDFEKKLELLMANQGGFVSDIQNLTGDRYYGKIVFTFEAGKIVHCKKEESIKINNPVRELKSVLESIL